MQREIISDALNFLKDDILEETDKVRSRRRQYRKIWWRWAVAAGAACFLFLFSAGILFLPQRLSDGTENAPEKSLDDIAELPKESSHPAVKLPELTVTEDIEIGAGFEGYMAHDVSELVNGNPWSETEKLSVLPVYRNHAFLGKGSKGEKADTDKMRECLIDVARRLDVDVDSLTITKSVIGADSAQDSAVFLSAQADGVEIEAARELTVDISFEPAIALPETYHITHSSTYEENAAAAGYLQEKYGKLIAMKNPQIDISGGDYGKEEDAKGFYQSYEIAFFDKGKSSTEQMINYNFNRVVFYFDDDGKLFLARVYQPDLSEKTGNYPLISKERAKKLLLNGNYITTVPDEFPGGDFIAKTELVYRTGTTEKYFMPYYRFYVELPDLEENGMKCYGVYYVPAVKEEYISNMPTWDGSMN